MFFLDDEGRASKTDRRMLVGDVTLADRYPVHGHLADAVIVHESCHQNQHVENLMRLELNDEGMKRRVLLVF